MCCFMNLRFRSLELVVFIASIVIVGCSSSNETAKDPSDEFRKHVRDVDARTPEEELAGFTVPEGFEIQLFASEPNIGKPLNMAFDDRGRMWLTQSFEYPFPDTTGRPADQISILEDTDGDGRADNFTVFADSLNIPIGIVTVPDGAIAYGIPNIYHLKDHDGDDKVDERNILYGGFGHHDTHGMINNLIRGWDGWIHAGHGFSNTSTVAGSDGDSITMVSGNTFRIRADGSRIELTTTGRVNPFGYAYDELGYTYSVDCHTSPIYQLVKGADYPHFGKKPTGIGFGPALMDHSYGATALAGLEYYLGDQFPPEYQESFYYGDVVKCRVYRATPSFNGTTPEIHQEDDFIVSEDPWFRPVDVKMGPDGALYIADFYNRIIGHYEVALDHPGRDRQRGRIWRVVAKDRPSAERVDLSALSLEELLALLDHPALPFRMSVSDQIVDRFGGEAVSTLIQTIQADNVPGVAYIQSLWMLYRLEALNDEILLEALAHEDSAIRVHALRIMYELDEMDATLIDEIDPALTDDDVHVRRQAVMVASRYPSPDRVLGLLNMLKDVETGDSHFYYSIRQSIRDHLRVPSIYQSVTQASWSQEDLHIIAELSRGVELPAAARFLLSILPEVKDSQELALQYTKHIAVNLPLAEHGEIVKIIQQLGDRDASDEYQYFQSYQEGMEQRGADLGSAAEDWAISMADTYLDQYAQGNGWNLEPWDDRSYDGNIWVKDSLHHDSNHVFAIASGNWQTNNGSRGKMWSPYFTIPTAMEFSLVGHKNEPGPGEEPTPPTCFVRLVAEDGSTLKEIAVEQPFQTEKVEWNVQEQAGKKGRLLLLDGSRSWLEFVGVADLPAPLDLPKVSPDQRSDYLQFASEIIGKYQIASAEASLTSIWSDTLQDPGVRLAAAEALMQINPKNSELLMEGEGLSTYSTGHLFETLAKHIDPSQVNRILAALDQVEYSAQQKIIVQLASQPQGINRILDAADSVQINPRLLMENNVTSALFVMMTQQQKGRLQEITANIRPPAEGIQDLIAERISNFDPETASVNLGSVIFQRFCSSCHQINNDGGNIGPQLDGIGNWGLHALTEKILDPNRNISSAFSNYIVQLEDGTIMQGLYRRDEGQSKIFADATGSEFSIASAEINKMEKSPYTLMPDHFGTIIEQDDFFDLIDYLLEEK